MSRGGFSRSCFRIEKLLKSIGSSVGQAAISFTVNRRFKARIVVLINNNNNNNNFIYIALKSNNCPKRYLITKKNIYKKNLNYKISIIYNIIQI